MTYTTAPVALAESDPSTEFAKTLIAEMFGVTQDVASGLLEPEFGWAIVHDSG
jgi:hypothetical protein